MTDPVKMRAGSFDQMQKDIHQINRKIDVYKAQANRVYYLAMLSIATLVTYISKIAWAKLSGIALITSSSMVLAVFAIALAGGTFLYWSDKNNKAKQIAQEISNLKLPKAPFFYGDTTERVNDTATPPAALENMQQSLGALHHQLPIHIDYILHVTYKIIIEGATAEKFTYSSERVKDNSEVVMATVGAWRKFYSELYMTESRTSIIMQTIATQCIQDLPAIDISDATQTYSCSSPTALNPESGTIRHSFKVALTLGTLFTKASQFRTYYADVPKTRKF